jgi:exodeoxyribonuclease VII large subunit
MEQFTLQWQPVEPERRIFTVTELNEAVRAMLSNEFQNIWVSGEISGTKTATSGHCYFTLKEADSQISCVSFRSTLRYLKFKPQDGVAVLARGSLDVYAARGAYQLIVEALEPRGHGALQFAFEQLKRKLGAEGLFDAARKRPIPKFPRRIGLVTSSTGAVIEDMLRILGRRFPGLHIRLFPARVQGDGSIEEVTAGLDYFSKSGWADVVIVGRGGGSLEDLWTFNEEAVARAIARCSVPVISAVGHETDVTIADFVADLRAPTPSAAAEMVICTRQELLDQLDAGDHRMVRAMRLRIAVASRRLHETGVDRIASILHRKVGRTLQRVDECDYRLRHGVREIADGHGRRLEGLERRLREMDLRLRLSRSRQRLEIAIQKATQSIRMHQARYRARFDPLAVHLAQLSPLRILDRGYAIVQDEEGRLVKDATMVGVDSGIRVRLARGRLAAQVTGVDRDI